MTEDISASPTLEAQLNELESRAKRYGDTPPLFKTRFFLQRDIAIQNGSDTNEANQEASRDMRGKLVEHERTMGFSSEKIGRFIFLNMVESEAVFPNWEKNLANAMEMEARRLETHDNYDRNTAMITTSALLRTHASVVRDGDLQTGINQKLGKDMSRLETIFDTIAATTDVLKTSGIDPQLAHSLSLQSAGYALSGPIRRSGGNNRGYETIETARNYFNGLAAVLETHQQ